MEIFEGAENSLKERADEIASLNTDRDARLKTFDEATRLQSEQLQTNINERDRVFNALPKALSAQYKRISARIRNGVAVAEARNGSCTACFMALRPQAMSQVRRGEELVTCDNCNRILYFAGTTPANASPVQPKVAHT